MSVGRYALGCLVLAACIVPLGWAAVRIRRRAVAGGPAPVQRLIESVLSTLWLVVLCEVLGTVSLFRAWSLAVCCVATGGAVGYLAGGGRTAANRSPAGRTPTFAWILLLAVGAVLASANAINTLKSLRGGIFDLDSQWFHLPIAASFVQQHSTTSLHQVSVQNLIPFYPDNVEILHAVGMLAFGRDIVSVFLNLVFVVIALLAAWCLGLSRRAAPLALLAVVAVLSAPQILGTEGGVAMVDTPALAMALTAVALLAHARSNRAVLATAAAAAGLSLGTKATMIAFAVVLGVGACLASRPRMRRAVAGVWVGGLILGGGYWYARNLLSVGNPIPGGLALLPKPHFNSGGGTFVSAVTHGQMHVSTVTHALDYALGPAWWALCAIAAVGLVAGLAPGRGGWERAASLAALTNVVAFPFSQYTNTLLRNNIRFLGPSLAIGFCLVATWPRLLARPRAVLGFGLALLVLIGVEVWRYGGYPGNGAVLVGILVFLVGAGVLVLRGRPPTRRALRLAGPALVLVIFGGGFALTRRYVEHRYRDVSADTLRGIDVAPALARTIDWAQGISHARIGVAGTVYEYSFYGADLTNAVKPVGVALPHGGLRSAETCQEWRQFVNAEGLDFLVISSSGDFTAPQAPRDPSWLRADPAVSVALNPGRGVTVYRITGTLHPRSCT